MRTWLLSTILILTTGCEFSDKLKIKQFTLKDERQKLVAIENLNAFLKDFEDFPSKNPKTSGKCVLKMIKGGSGLFGYCQNDSLVSVIVNIIQYKGSDSSSSDVPSHSKINLDKFKEMIKIVGKGCEIPSCQESDESVLNSKESYQLIFSK